MNDERKAKKLKYLFFHCGGYFETNELIMLIINYGCLSIDCYLFSHEHPRETIPHFHADWAKERSKRWLFKIEQTHFELWEDKYWADVYDGEQWKLRFQFEGESERIIFGSNAYPETWPQFIELMTTIARKLPRVEDAEIHEILGSL